MNRNEYKTVSSFGNKTVSPVNNPLTYCIGNNMDQRFLHGSHADTYGQNSRSCQLFLSEYCADKWDGFCEIASKNGSVSFPNQAQFLGCNSAGIVGVQELTAGESLVHSTASRKYLSKMINGVKNYEPFDPTVPNSPLISYWTTTECSNYRGKIPVYEVDAKKIDNDIVMNKILQKPVIAMDILINIYNTMKRKGTLSTLNGTKLGKFYNSFNYFVSKGGVPVPEKKDDE